MISIVISTTPSLCVAILLGSSQSVICFLLTSLNLLAKLALDLVIKLIIFCISNSCCILFIIYITKI